MSDRTPGPLLIELDAPPEETPATAPLVTGEDLPEGRAMQIATRLVARKPSPLWRLFWQSGVALLGFFVSLMAWNWVTSLLASHPVLGWIAAVLAGLFISAALGLALREWAAYARLARLDAVAQLATRAIADKDMGAAEDAVSALERLYAGRAELSWGLARLKEGRAQAFDADALVGMAETALLGPLDDLARLEIEAASRTVATVTALVPLALADVFAALAANLRMIRRIAEIYGGRAGSFGSLRLARTVLTHLVATGAVAVGDDMIETVASGGLLSKLSRRFGEGVVNGALTARVGVAAMEVCRPLPFTTLQKPRVTNLVGRALKGLFGNRG